MSLRRKPVSIFFFFFSALRAAYLSRNAADRQNYLRDYDAAGFTSIASVWWNSIFGVIADSKAAQLSIVIDRSDTM